MPEHTYDVLGLDPRDYKRMISVDLDVELIERLDARRGAASRSAYVEHALVATKRRVVPHLPDGWTPETAAQETCERMGGHAERERDAEGSD